MGDCDRHDQRVIGPGLRFPTGSPERGGHPAERPRPTGVERDRVEVGLRLLKVGESDRAFCLVIGHQRAQPVEPVAAVFAQVADGHAGHGSDVLPVRPQGVGPRARTKPPEM